MDGATCQDCASPSPSPTWSDGSANLRVILGVLGGIALAAIAVVVCVRCARRRVVRMSEGDGTSARWDGWRWPWTSAGRDSPARYPGFRHHQETKTGRDALFPLLLPLTQVSRFTWPAVQRSQQSHSAESTGADAASMDLADEHSLPTDNAATSHHRLADRLICDIDTASTYSVLGGPGGAAQARGSASVSPASSKRSQDPLQLLSARSKALSLPHPNVLLAGPSAAHGPPRSRVSPPHNAPDATYYSCIPHMDPLLDQPARKPSSSSSQSRRGSLQLPSPPASPPLASQASSSSSHSKHRSYVPTHSRSSSHASVQQADWRFNAARPPSSSAAPAPATTSLPFRPTSSSSKPSSWSSPVATNLGFPASPPRSPPAPSIHLTSAFRTSLHRTGTASTATTTDTGRYPSIVALSPPPIPETEAWAPSSSSSGRARSGSVASERPLRVPHGARPKPVEDLLRQEGVDTGGSGRSGRRASMSAAPSSSSPLALSPAESSARRAYLRSSIAVQTPRIEEPSASTARGRSAALSYLEGRAEQPSSSTSRSTAGRDGSSTPTSTDTHTGHTSTSHSHPHSQSRSSSHVRGTDNMRSPEELQAQLAAYSLSPSRRSSISVARPPSVAPRSHHHSSSQQQPALVPKKDSLALKPLPVSALLHSPPHSPPRSGSGYTGASAPSAFARVSRSRAGSIASVATPEGSVYEGRTGRSGGSSRTYLPPVEPLPPMEFAKFSGDGDEDEDPRRRRRESRRN